MVLHQHFLYIVFYVLLHHLTHTQPFIYYGSAAGEEIATPLSSDHPSYGSAHPDTLPSGSHTHTHRHLLHTVTATDNTDMVLIPYTHTIVVQPSHLWDTPTIWNWT